MQTLTIQQSIEMAKKNPESEFATQLRQAIESGKLDEPARKQGYDLSRFGRNNLQQDSPVQDIKKMGQDIVKSIKTRAEDYRESQAGEIPNQTKLEQVATSAGALAGGVGDVVANVVTGVARAVLPQGAEDKVNELVQKLGTAISKTEAAKAYEEWSTNNPADAKAIEGVVNIASLIPIGAGGKVATEGIEQAGKATLAGVKNVAKGVANVTPEIASVGGNVAKRTAEKLVNVGIRSGVDEAKVVQAFEAATPLPKRAIKIAKGELETPRTTAKTAVERGIMGRSKDVGTFAKREANKLYSESINPALKSLDDAGEKITKDELFNKAKSIVDNEVDPTKKKSLELALESLQEDYSTIDSIDYTSAEKLKQALNKRTPTKLFKGQEVASEVQTLKKAIADDIRAKIYDKLGADIKKQYLDYGNLQQLQQVGIKARTQAGRLGGAGNLVSFILDQAIVPVSTVGGRIIYKIGDAFEFIGKQGKSYKYADDVVKDLVSGAGKITGGAAMTTTKKSLEPQNK